RRMPGGFYETKVAIFALRGELSGVFPSGLYKDYVRLEWVESRYVRIRKLKDLARHCPAFAPAWKDLAYFLDKPQLQLEAVGRGLAASPDATTKAFLLLRKAAVLEEQGNDAESMQILRQIVADEALDVRARDWARFVVSQELGGG